MREPVTLSSLRFGGRLQSGGPIYGNDQAYANGKTVGQVAVLAAETAVFVSGTMGLGALALPAAGSGALGLSLVGGGQLALAAGASATGAVAVDAALAGAGIYMAANTARNLGGGQGGGGGSGGDAPSGGDIPASGKLNPPNATDPVLQDAYMNLWRPGDVNPGGTIGELLREVQAGGPLKHLEKAKGRLQQLISRVTDTSNPLSAADRAGAERVISDLKEASRVAEGP